MKTPSFIPLFTLGKTCITPAAGEILTEKIARDLLKRHICGDWGDMEDEDKRANDNALGRELRIFSAYDVGEGERVWVITEADRSSTTILLPGDY